MLTTSDIARVLSRYDLGSPEGQSATGHGFVNETAIVVTRRGRFVVRRNHRRFSQAAHQSRHALIGWLCCHGVPTARLLPTSSGETLLALDGRFYEVQEFIDGHDYDSRNLSQTLAAGAALAGYHEAARQFPGAVEHPDPRYAPQAVSALCERLIERDIMGELHAELTWYDARAAQLRKALPSAIYDTLPHLPIHGDVHADNFRFMADCVAGLLDFDQVVWDARIADVADALVAFATAVSERGQGWGVFGGALDEERARELLAGYVAVTPLSEAEHAALPVALEVLWLRGELGRVLSTPEGAPDYHLEVLGQGRRLSQWLAGHAELLTAACPVEHVA